MDFNGGYLHSSPIQGAKEGKNISTQMSNGVGSTHVAFDVVCVALVSLLSSFLTSRFSSAIFSPH